MDRATYLRLSSKRLRNRGMKLLREKGWSMERIAKHYGVTKQRVQQLLRTLV